MRVASFNIRNGRALDGWDSWPFRRRATLATIRALDADVLGLQEVFPFQRRWVARRMRTHAVLGEFRDDGRRGEGTPLLVRRELDVSDDWTRWFGGVRGGRLPDASFPRIATSALVDGVRMTNVHLDEHHDANRRGSLDELVSWLDPDEPQVVLGDFNATTDDDVFDVLTRRGFRHALPAAAHGTAHDFTGRTTGRRIDHLLVSSSIVVREARVVTTAGRLPSDHWPVVADLTVDDDRS